MNNDQIKQEISNLIKAVGEDDQNLALASVANLFAAFMLNQARIADALEKLAAVDKAE